MSRFLPKPAATTTGTPVASTTADVSSTSRSPSTRVASSIHSDLIYVPCASLDENDIRSLLNIAESTDKDRVDLYGGRKVALKYLLSMKSFGYQFPAGISISDEKWKSFEKSFKKLKSIDYSKEEFSSPPDRQVEDYWELKYLSPNIHPVAINSRRFNRYDKGIDDRKLKIYFNPRQFDNIIYSRATYEQAGFVDEDCRENLIKYPLNLRKNRGEIATVQGRIENVIFDVPSSKQIIVLDFADERMPGGLFLYGATTQEETICYHSETYRALLDLKYRRFQGGFYIPEFGCLYMKDLQFHHPPDYDKSVTIDVIAAACYDLTGVHGLHKRPTSDEQVLENTEEKLRSIIRSAQVNSKDNGKDTYLLLGPIGCGAFKNDLQQITKLWAKILLEPLNEQLETKQKDAFDKVFFISGTNEKLKVFQDIFQLNSPTLPTPTTQRL